MEEAVLVVEQTDAAPATVQAHRESPHAPPGPWHGIWSIRYLDKLTSATLMLCKARRQASAAFPDALPPGTAFPAMRLETRDGRTVNTGRLQGAEATSW